MTTKFKKTASVRLFLNAALNNLKLAAVADTHKDYVKYSEAAVDCVDQALSHAKHTIDEAEKEVLKGLSGVPEIPAQAKK